MHACGALRAGARICGWAARQPGAGAPWRKEERMSRMSMKPATSPVWPRGEAGDPLAAAGTASAAPDGPPLAAPLAASTGADRMRCAASTCAAGTAERCQGRCRVTPAQPLRHQWWLVGRPPPPPPTPHPQRLVHGGVVLDRGHMLRPQELAQLRVAEHAPHLGDALGSHAWGQRARRRRCRQSRNSDTAPCQGGTALAWSRPGRGAKPTHRRLWVACHKQARNPGVVARERQSHSRSTPCWAPPCPASSAPFGGPAPPAPVFEIAHMSHNCARGRQGGV